MSKRAEDVAGTRQRIVDAAVRLHGTIGPAATTISALAQEAGVTRLTVYRHFPDDSALFAACSQHWASGQVLPNPKAWLELSDPAERLHAGLSDLYRFYQDAEPMLTNVRRDRARVPLEIRRRTEATDAEYANTLLQPFAARGSRRQGLLAVLGHAVSFWTWRSLCLDNGLTIPAAVEAMTALAVATADKGLAAAGSQPSDRTASRKPGSREA
ncbi:MAG: helix-turn-helix domain-containing protein [Dermatophilaceae bacterium]